jgi:hypothetical protein
MCDQHSFRPAQQYFRASKDQLDALQATVTDYVLAPEDQKPALLKQHGRIIQEIKDGKV